MLSIALTVCILALGTGGLAAAQGADDLSFEAFARKQADPIASVIGVPLRFNDDGSIGPIGNRHRTHVDVQPVMPVHLGPNWKVISRTILPVTWQDNILPGAGSQFEFGDSTRGLWLSPVEPIFGSIVWGVGPAFLPPTATDKWLNWDEWAVGPTIVVLKRSGPCKVGVLANHIWSVAGDDDQPNVSKSFAQPFLAYTTPNAFTFTLNTKSSIDWEADDWSVPINALVSKMFVIGDRRIQVGAGARYWAESSVDGSEGFSGRLHISFQFPD